MYRAVLDTNAYVSAVIFGGKPETLFRLSWRPHRQFRLHASHEILKETARILAGDEFSFYREEITAVIATIAAAAEVVEPGAQVSVLADDPDNRVLECALAARAHFIVSGDSHLVKLGEYQGAEIVKPARFLALLEKER